MYFDNFSIELKPTLIVQENHYYPFGLNLAGLEKRGQPNHRWQFQGQEIQAEFGLNWSSFKWRNADVAIGRFHSVDPLAEDYVYNSVYAFAENKVIDHYELEGLEGVQIHTYDKEGNLKGITYQLDVYVLIDTYREYASNFTENDVTRVQEALDMAYGGEHTDPNSGVPVNFSFNVQALDMSVEVTKTKRNSTTKTKQKPVSFSKSDVLRERSKRGEMGENNEGAPHFTVPVLVASQSDIIGTDGGDSSVGVRVDPESKEGLTGALGHEVGHFMLANSDLKNDHNLRGIMGRPFTNPWINKALLKELRKSVPRVKKRDKTIDK